VWYAWSSDDTKVRQLSAAIVSQAISLTLVTWRSGAQRRQAAVLFIHKRKLHPQRQHRHQQQQQ